MANEITITTWINREKNSFENFDEFIATRLETGMMKALAEKMKNDLKSNDSSRVKLPWGIFTASVVKSGDTGNINIAYEPSKGFMDVLDESSESVSQDEFDPEYSELFHDYVAYGFFYPNAPENKDCLEKNVKCINMADEEIEYFLNGYADTLAQIAKDKQRDGKTYRLEVGSEFDHGAYDFEYSNDKIIVKFTASKIFKQYLKNDALANG